LCKCVNNYDEITRFYNKNQPLKFTRLSAKKKYLLTLFLFLLALLLVHFVRIFPHNTVFFSEIMFFFRTFETWKPSKFRGDRPQR
jgi:hypothetical protein